MVQGYEVVIAIEACGSRSGDTSYDVMIADCGQLPAGKCYSVLLMHGAMPCAGLMSLLCAAVMQVCGTRAEVHLSLAGACHK